MRPGESGLGKTTLINTLFSTELSQPKNYKARFAKQLDKTTEVDIIKAEVRSLPPSCAIALLTPPLFLLWTCLAGCSLRRRASRSS
jgi:cell division control protein 12